MIHYLYYMPPFIPMLLSILTFLVGVTLATHTSYVEQAGHVEMRPPARGWPEALKDRFNRVR